MNDIIMCLTIIWTQCWYVICVGMAEDDLFSDVTPEHPSVVTVSCTVATSNDVYWSRLTINHNKQVSYHQGVEFYYNLSSYDQSVKFICHSDNLHSIIYVHPKSE